jgi:hypothetical protein
MKPLRGKVQKQLSGPLRGEMLQVHRDCQRPGCDEVRIFQARVLCGLRQRQ